MSTPAAGISFVETHVFTRRITSLGLEDAVRDLQLLLLQVPDVGDLDPGTGGLRKVRIPDPRRGKGKRSGARVHYLWLPSVSVIYLLSVYSKGESSTLRPTEKRQMRAVVKAIRREWRSRE